MNDQYGIMRNMHDPVPGDLDLNLLRVLDVVLDERSTTRAAQRLGRSQPAVSHALARLREALGDELLVREGRGMVPTPRAEAMREPLRRSLQALGDAVRTRGGFDPVTSRRRFVLASPGLLAAIVPSILAGCADAPGVSVELVAHRGVGALEMADLVLDLLPDEAPGVVARGLGRLHQAVVVRRGHPFADAPTLDAYVAFPHVLVRTEDGRASLVERALAALGRRRTVGLAVDSMLLAPHVVAGTDMLFTGPREVLATLEHTLDLVLVEPPLPMPEVRVAAMWRARDAGDPGHRWFRERVVEVLEHTLRGPVRT